jgi:hypothetical protein
MAMEKVKQVHAVSMDQELLRTDERLGPRD